MDRIAGSSSLQGLTALAVTAEQASFPQTRPALPLCPRCRKQFGTASLPLHVQRCTGTSLDPEQSRADPPSQRRASARARGRGSGIAHRSSAHPDAASSSRLGNRPSSASTRASERKVPAEIARLDGGYSGTGSLRREALTLSSALLLPSQRTAATHDPTSSSGDFPSASPAGAYTLEAGSEVTAASAWDPGLQDLAGRSDHHLPNDTSISSDAAVSANWIHPNLLHTLDVESKAMASSSTARKRVPSLTELCLIELSKQLHVIRWENEFFQSAAQSSLLCQLPPNFLSGIILGMMAGS